MAIGAFEAGRVRLICGGYDKKVDLGALGRAADACACVRTIGATGDVIAGLVGGEARCVGTLERAFGEVVRGARAGDVVHLPALANMALGALFGAAAGLLFLRSPAISTEDRTLLAAVFRGKEAKLMQKVGILRPGT
jgi:hypothetical protein